MKQRLSLFLLCNTISITFASEKAPISYLELFPGEGLKPVALGHPYHHMTEEEKHSVKFVEEGNYTVLADEKDCALVGSLQPCQLFVLYVANVTIVAHLSMNSNVSDLLDTIKKDFSHIDSASITGELFTSKWKMYEKNYSSMENKSYKDYYQNRSQIQELKYNKDLIVSKFDIIDRNQIKAYIFTSNKKKFELGNYLMAECFCFVKYKSIFNTCPIAERYFGNFDHLPLKERFNQYIVQRYALSMHNPYLNQFEGLPPYGSIPFVRI